MIWAIILVLWIILDGYLWFVTRRYKKEALGFYNEAIKHKNEASEMYKDATRNYKAATALHSHMQDTLRSEND